MRRRLPLLLVLAAVGCFVDYAPVIDPPDTTTGGATTTTGESTEASSSETTIALPDDYDECLDKAHVYTCDACICQHCSAELLACAADSGCRAIETCVYVEGCSGDACLELCRDEIDAHGGLDGPSHQLSLAFSDCTHTACPALSC